MNSTLQSVDPPVASPSASTGLDALLQSAAVASLDNTGWIRVTASDRVRWLNGMVTNSIAGLAAGEGCYNFVLNAQGRIQGDLTAWLLEDEILLETDREQIPTLLTHFDRFIIMDDVELAEPKEDRAGILIAGPDAKPILNKLGISAKPLSPHSLHSTEWNRNPIQLIQAHSPLVPRFEIWSDLTTILELDQALAAAGIPPASPQALEALRILSGTPRYGTDIRNTDTAHDLPQETGQTRALHFAKGCYLGQEIVERIRSRGKVHRAFSGFALTGALPPAGTALMADGKAAGELTSVAAIPLPSGTVQLALGYVRREALDRGLPLEYPGGTASPIDLPYKGAA